MGGRQDSSVVVGTGRTKEVKTQGPPPHGPTGLRRKVAWLRAAKILTICTVRLKIQSREKE